MNTFLLKLSLLKNVHITKEIYGEKYQAVQFEKVYTLNSY